MLTRYLSSYDNDLPESDSDVFTMVLPGLNLVGGDSEHARLSKIRAQVSRGDIAHAQVMLAQALKDFPDSTELRRLQAGIFQQTGLAAEAEVLFRQLLALNSGDRASSFSLARLLKEQGCMAEVASILQNCFAAEPNRGDAELAIAIIELLDDCERKRDAAAVAQSAIADNPNDARLHAYAGMLEMQLGDFDRARKHYRFAMEHDARAWEWHVPIGLSHAQRYTRRDHADFTLFADGLQRDGLSGIARAELYFASGKAFDDIGEHKEAARHFREGNAIARRATPWSSEAWRQAAEARLSAQPMEHVEKSSDDFAPVFIVGMPRSGTTLLAQRLARFPKTCNRGELPWIAWLAERFESAENPRGVALARATAVYMRQSRQDDAADAHWFIDKQPLNFRYIDFIMAMFAHAKIVHCRRSPRDTAVSLWMQSFREEVQAYSCDFDDIALVMRDEEKLMMHWRALYPHSIRTVNYEDVVTKTNDTIGSLAEWIGFSTRGRIETEMPGAAISTASLWQARQSLNARSIGRWKNYLPFVPELLQFSA
jgi:tetratricopeptide (TPR) repeat protein